MAWTSPMTAIASTALTAAQYNTNVRDNLLETLTAKCTAAGQHLVTVDDNQVGLRQTVTATVATSQTTTSTSYTDLATVGPTVSCETGAWALIFWTATISNSGVNHNAIAVEITGASLEAASDTYKIQVDGATLANTNRIFGAREVYMFFSGSKTFTMKYRVGAGTGTFVDRKLAVFPL